MSTQMSEDDIRNKARMRVRAKMGFFRHLTVYLIVNAFLVLIWALSSAGVWWAWWGQRYSPAAGTAYFWPGWVMLFWGIGLVSHCLSVFVFHGNWEENEVEKEVQRIKKRQDQG